MAGSNFVKFLLTLFILSTLAVSCINVNMPGGSQGTTPPTGSNVTEPPTIETFSASPENLLSGKSGTLIWSVKGADSIMITPDVGKVDASGSKTVQPANETTYTLVASNSAGLVARPVTIKILTVSRLEVGLKEIEKPGSGTQTTPQGSDKYIVGTLGIDLQNTNRPDLSIVAGDISTHKGIHVAFQIKNLGSANSNPMDAVLKIDGSVKSSYHITQVMHAGDVTAARFDDYNLTPDPNAMHNIEILIDVNNTNIEQNENNNSLKFTAPYY